MLNDKLKIKVTCDWQDIAEVTDPSLAMKVLGLIAEHQKANPETPEQALVRELRQAKEDADTRAYQAEDRAKRTEKQLAELTKAVAELKKPADLEAL